MRKKINKAIALLAVLGILAGSGNVVYGNEENIADQEEQQCKSDHCSKQCEECQDSCAGMFRIGLQLVSYGKCISFFHCCFCRRICGH